MSFIVDAVDQNGQESYRLVFWGETATGHSRATVARAFARKFNVKSRRQLQRLFSGKLVTLKHGLTIEQAHRYIQAIQALGAVCRMESERRDYFGETELKTKKRVTFLENDVDMSQLSLAPKE